MTLLLRCQGPAAPTRQEQGSPTLVVFVQLQAAAATAVAAIITERYPASKDYLPLMGLDCKRETMGS